MSKEAIQEEKTVPPSTSPTSPVTPTQSQPAEKVSDTINLNRKKLTEEDIDLVKKQLRMFPIKRLFLGYSGLTIPMVENLLSIFPQTTLEELVLKGNTLNEDPRNEDSNWLKDLPNKFPHLRYLDLNETGINKDGFANLIKAISSLGNTGCLERLDVGFNKLQDIGILPLFDLLKKYPRGMQDNGWDLRLAGNELTIKTADNVLALIKQGVFFKTIQLDNNSIPKEKLTVINEAIEKANKNRSKHEAGKNSPLGVVSPAPGKSPNPSSPSSSFSVLDLSGQNFTVDQLPLIKSILDKNPQARTLILKGNCFGDPDFLSNLLDTICQHGAIRHLDLSNNQIGEAGARIIAEKLADTDTALHSLHLSNNNLGDAGISHLFKWIKKQTDLKKLVLDENKLGDKGICILAKALEGHPSLEELSIDRNQIGRTGLFALLVLFQKNSAIYQETGHASPLGILSLKVENKSMEALYEVLQLSVRLFGWLNYEKKLLTIDANLNAIHSVFLDAQNTFLTALSGFLKAQKETPSLEKSTIEESYLSYLKKARERALKDAKDYFEQKAYGKQFTQIMKEVNDKIEAIYASYDCLDQLDSWLQKPEDILKIWESCIKNIQEERVKVSEEIKMYHAKLHKIDEEQEQLKTKLLHPPVPSKEISQQIEAAQKGFQSDRTLLKNNVDRSLVAVMTTTTTTTTSISTATFDSHSYSDYYPHYYSPGASTLNPAPGALQSGAAFFSGPPPSSPSSSSSSSSSNPPGPLVGKQGRR